MTAHHEFSCIYNDYYPRILRYITRIVGETDAEDVAQDVFDKVNRALGNFHGKSKLSTWIYRIATNTAIDRTRSAAYKQAASQRPLESGAPQDAQCKSDASGAPPTDHLVIQKEMNACINEYIDTLPPNYKTVIVLSDLEGLTNKEIAEVLGISLENAKVRIHRARAKLKDILKAACDFYYTGQNNLACDRKQVQILPKPPK